MWLLCLIPAGFGSADTTVTAECTAAPMVAAGRFAAPTARKGGTGASAAAEVVEGSAAGDAAPTEVGSTEAAEGRNEAEEGSTEAEGRYEAPSVAEGRNMASVA